MTISERDLKVLWGSAAGRCSRPGCDEECIRFLDHSDPTIIGEMAHIIAKKPQGPRGVETGGEDTYENLILLCPTHHTEIDKASDGVYSADILYQWKKSHEDQVRNSFQGSQYESLQHPANVVMRYLIENKTASQQYGPESEEAKHNPLSSMVQTWALRKLDTIVPNNRRIINIIKQNRSLFELNDYQKCALFIEHAEGFERNCYQRTEGALRFPVDFERLIDGYARAQ